MIGSLCLRHHYFTILPKQSKNNSIRSSTTIKRYYHHQQQQQYQYYQQQRLRPFIFTGVNRTGDISTTTTTTTNSKKYFTSNNNSTMTTTTTSNANEKPAVKESTIRLMTRLAMKYSAINLSQGFPNEAPPIQVRMALAYAVLTGNPLTLQQPQGENDSNNDNNVTSIQDDEHYKALVQTLSNMATSTSESDSELSSSTSTSSFDVLNQYSPPMGRPDVRNAIAGYYQRLYDYTVDPENCITVTLGATEAFACAIRTLVADQPNRHKAVIFEPFHELYANQCLLFHVEPVYVTLKPTTKSNSTNGGGRSFWDFDRQELEMAMKDAKMILLNTPHNPTGKVFSYEELQYIVELALKYNVYIITDEIYEHMCYDNHNDNNNDDNDNTETKQQPQNQNQRHQHYLLPKVFPQVAHLCFICNSLGKSASATGWRVGWCLHPSTFSSTYRGIHDQLTVMSPHPMQYATLTYLNDLPISYFQNELSTRYLSRLQLLATTLQTVGFQVIQNPPDGAYYLFVKYNTVPALQPFYGKPMDAAMYMIQTVGVACVPGDNFYGSSKAIEEEGKHYLRFAACRSQQDIEEACRRLKKAFLE